MNRLVKSKRKRRARRDLFAELSEGINALADARRGKQPSELTPWNSSAHHHTARTVAG